MTPRKAGSLIAVGAVVLAGIIIALVFVGYSNKEIELRNQFDAQVNANKAVFDKVWKIIKSQAQVTDKYAGDFKSVYDGMIGKRYEGEANGAPAFKWIKEQNPTFTPELYSKLQDTITAQRTEFTMVQKRMIDIKRVHDNLRQRFPSKMVVGGRDELVMVVVTSTKTEKTFETGKEDDVDLF